MFSVKSCTVSNLVPVMEVEILIDIVKDSIETNLDVV